MTERKMCKFYNLNVPERRIGELPLNIEQEEEDERPPNEDDPPSVPAHEHKLEYYYWMWFSRRPPVRDVSVTTQGYGQALRLVGRVGSVEQWWGLYCHLARPSELPPLSDLHLFKLGIKPMWEDPANVNGGKWLIRLRKNQTDSAWEDLCMAMLGEQFMIGSEDICGIVLSVRFQEDHLALWFRNAEDTETTDRLRDTLRRVLQLPAALNIEYKVHRDCLDATTSRQNHDENHVEFDEDDDYLEYEDAELDGEYLDENEVGVENHVGDVGQGENGDETEIPTENGDVTDS